MLVVLNLPLIGMWIRLLTVPYRLLFPAILMFICIGAYSINNNLLTSPWPQDSDFWGMFFQARMRTSPLLLGYILGPMMEESLRRAMRLSGATQRFSLHGRSALRCCLQRRSCCSSLLYPFSGTSERRPFGSRFLSGRFSSFP